MTVPMLNVSHARLPQTYEAAKQALAECSRIDECKDWADKAEALASYARQAEDDTLRKMADRIQARAVRRAGELLKTYDARGGDRSKNNGADDFASKPEYRCPVCNDHFSAQVWHCTACDHHWPMARDYCANCHSGKPMRSRTAKLVGSRSEVADAAGMSQRQSETAVRVANVPQPNFDAAVESDNPPTVTALAEQGKKSRAPEPPEGFRQATHLIGTVKRFAAFCGEHEPEFVANGVLPQEANEIRGLVASIDHWLDRFVVNLRNEQ